MHEGCIQLTDDASVSYTYIHTSILLHSEHYTGHNYVVCEHSIRNTQVHVRFHHIYCNDGAIYLHAQVIGVMNTS